MKIRPDNVSGEEGLLVAVILQATKDYQSRDVLTRGAAAVYFLSDDYRGHLDWLGLPDDRLPERVINGRSYDNE